MKKKDITLKIKDKGCVICYTQESEKKRMGDPYADRCCEYKEEAYETLDKGYKALKQMQGEESEEGEMEMD